MSRSRNIKPGLFKNEILGVADPIYTLAFEGLWLLADKMGRLEDRPLRIKAETFPYRDGLNIEAILDWLVTAKFIVRYAIKDKRYIEITNFTKHQNPHKNEAESVIPPYVSVDIPNKSVEVPRKSEPLGLIPDSLNTDSLSSSPKKYSDDDLSDAQSMFAAIQQLNPKHKTPDFDKWADEVRLIRERDNRTREEIMQLFHWANADPFWQTNILSPAKLREKWDVLTMQTKRKEHAKTQHTGKPSLAERATNARKEYERSIGIVAADKTIDGELVGATDALVRA